MSADQERPRPVEGVLQGPPQVLRVERVERGEALIEYDERRMMTRWMLAVPRPIEVRPRPNYRLWIRYDDGAEGEVDLSNLVGRGVFHAWDVAVFEAVRLGPYGEIMWGKDLDLCPATVYMRLTGKTPDLVFPSLSQVNA